MKCKQCKREIDNGSTFCNWCGKKQITDRQQGEISIPKARQLSSGKWFIQLRIDGKSVSITEDTLEFCKTKARAIKSGLIKTRPKSGSTTLNAAIDKYIEERCNSLSPSTIRGYRTIQKHRFQSVINNNLTDISEWQKICNFEAKLCSAKTLKNSWRFVASVLRENGIQPPKVTLPQIVANERPWLEPEQTTKFVKAVKGQDCEIPALLALHSLRRSEICALTWNRVDLEKREIFVAGSAVFNADHKLEYKNTNKNTASRRHVPIMIDALYDALSICKNKTGLVVTCNPNTIWAQINRICKANNLPPVGVHGLRHSFASLAYHLSMPEKECMKIGGWTDSETMHNIYTHIAEADIKSHENLMAKFYNNANKNANTVNSKL